MPRLPDGTWTPPPPHAGWDEYRALVVGLADPFARPDAAKFLRTCEAAGENPNRVLRRWAYWHGVFDKGRMIPPNWPAALTPGDWKSLAMFAEAENPVPERAAPC